VTATRLLRRAADVVLGLVGLVVTLPTMLLLALAIKGTSPGRCWSCGGRFGPPGSMVGRFMRRTRLDEVAQFWHLLLGKATLFDGRWRVARIAVLENASAGASRLRRLLEDDLSSAVRAAIIVGSMAVAMTLAAMVIDLVTR